MPESMWPRQPEMRDEGVPRSTGVKVCTLPKNDGKICKFYQSLEPLSRANFRLSTTRQGKVLSSVQNMPAKAGYGSYLHAVPAGNLLLAVELE